MGWLIALTAVAVIAAVPIGIRGMYDQSGAVLQLLLGPFALPLFPRKKSRKPSKNASGNASGKRKAADAKQPGSVSDFLPIIDLVLKFLGDFRRKLTVRHLEMKLFIAGDDPSDVAVRYGNAWAVLGNLIPQLDRIFRIKKRDMSVECDFLSDSPRIYARADITISVGGLAALSVLYGSRGLREYLKLMNLRKGGAK